MSKSRQWYYTCKYFPKPEICLYRAVTITSRPRILKSVVVAVVAEVVNDEAVVDVNSSLINWVARREGVATSAVVENVNDVVIVGGGHPSIVNSLYNEQANSMLGSNVVEAESSGVEIDVDVKDWTSSLKLVGIALVIVRKVVLG